MNGERFYLPRLVLIVFVGPCPDGMECCHGDGDPANNHVLNLRWDTRTGNVADTIKHGRTPRGEKNHFSKLSDEDVSLIRQLSAEGHQQLALAERFGCSRPLISTIINRRTWKHLRHYGAPTKGTHKLTEEAKAEIVSARRSGQSAASLALRFSIDKSMVYKLMNTQR